MNSRHVTSVRSFNRFYTNITGLLNRFILDSNYSLPEIRVLYEIYYHYHYHSPCTAKQIMTAFTIDKGYLSRLLVGLQRKKLIDTRPSPADRRSVLLKLTPKGIREFEKLDAAADKKIRAMLAHLTTAHCEELVHHMNQIKNILSEKQA